MSPKILRLFSILLLLVSVFIISSCDVVDGLEKGGLSSEGSEIETKVHYKGIPVLLESKLNFTLDLTETVYTTSSDKINFRIRAKEPSRYMGRGDKWQLYRIENEEALLIGEISHEIALEYTALDGEEYIERDEYLLIKSLCGSSNLTVGKYCLVHPIQAPDENGYYQTYSGALMYFEVVE